MELGTIITGAVLMGMAFIPIMIINHSRRSREKTFGKAFETVCRNQQFEPEQYEQWHKKALGINQKEKKLLYYSQVEGQCTEELVDLNRIKKCDYTVVNRKVKLKKTEDSFVEHLHIRFHPKEKNSEVITLPLYDAESTYLPDGDMERAQRWVKIINTCLN